MKKKIEKVLRKSWLLFLCISSIVFAACKEQPEIYLETYIDSEHGEMQNDTMSEITTEEGVTEVATDRDIVNAIELSDDAEQANLLYVYVCGAVRCPDVYALLEGSRICDAIDMAGGLREDADAMSVNQAQLVYDGQMLRIYTCEETASGLGVEQTAADMASNESSEDTAFIVEQDDKININTATRSQLMMLPGIGSARADAILDYRLKQGDFDKIEDLMKIPGIKEGIFEQIREQISVD